MSVASALTPLRGLPITAQRQISEGITPGDDV
jgi:hypothetical protein